MFCPECGKKIGDSSKFCHKCSYHLESNSKEETSVNSSKDNTNTKQTVNNLYDTYRRPYWGSDILTKNKGFERKTRYGMGWDIFRIITAIFNPILYLLGMGMGIYKFDLCIFIIVCVFGLGIYMYIGWWCQNH